MKKIMFNEQFGLEQATLDGTKTMTRRIVPQVILDYVPKYQQEYYEQTLSTISFEDAILNMVGAEKMFQRYVYNVGEIVAIAQRYSQIEKEIKKLGLPFDLKKHKGYNNKMFVRAEDMPDHIKITDRKLEHLQDISDEDCLKEGVRKGFIGYYVPRIKCKNWEEEAHVDTKDGHTWKLFPTPQEAFAAMIDKVSGKGTWESNPLVFAYEYKRID